MEAAQTGKKSKGEAVRDSNPTVDDVHKAKARRLRRGEVPNVVTDQSA
jgi:hypothetical protein